MAFLEEDLALELLLRERLVLRLRMEDGPRALSALKALRRGGIRAVDIDPPGPGPAAFVLSRLRREHPVLVGAGSLVTAEQVREASRFGAAWGVIPGPRKDLVDAGREEGLLLLVRVRTEADLSRALRLDAACLLLAPPLAGKGCSLPRLLGEGALSAGIEAPWGASPPPWASFHLVTRGLLPQGFLEEGRFPELERLVGEGLEELAGEGREGL